MNKFLKINTLAVATAIVATLWGCGGQGNNQAQNGAEQGGASQTQTPASENAASNSDAIDQVVKQQEQSPNQDVNDEPLPAETVKEAYSVPSELKYYKPSDEYLLDAVDELAVIYHVLEVILIDADSPYDVCGSGLFVAVLGCHNP